MKDRFGAVRPGTLEIQLHVVVRQHVQPVIRKRGAQHVTAQCFATLLSLAATREAACLDFCDTAPDPRVWKQDHESCYDAFVAFEKLSEFLAAITYS